MSRTHSHLFTRLLTAAIAALALLFAGLVTTSVPAEAIGIGTGATVRGTVNDAITGDPVQADVDLYVWNDADEWWEWHDWTETTGGAYRFDGLPAGTYYVAVYGNGYKTAWSGDAPWGPYLQDDLGAFEVGADEEYVENFALRQHVEPGYVEGTVSNVDGAPLDDIKVEAVPVGDPTGTAADTTYSWDGDYSLEVEPGNYVLRFTDEYDDAYNSVSSPEQTVASGETTTYHATMVRPGAADATGRIMSADGPLEEAYVEVYRRISDGGETWWSWEDDTYTDEDGTYTFDGLKAGRVYTVRAWADGYGTRYLGGAYHRSDADTFDAAAGGVVADLVLPVANVLSGRVTGGGEPLEDVELELLRWDEAASDFESVNWGYTDDDGTYTIEDAPAGCYTILASRWGGDEYSDTYLGGSTTAPTSCPAAGGSTFTTATDATDVAGLDIAMLPAYTVTGSVDREGGTPLAYALVELYVWDGTEFSYEKDLRADVNGEFAAKLARDSIVTWSADKSGFAPKFLGGGSDVPSSPTETNSVRLDSDPTSLGALSLAVDPDEEVGVRLAGTATAGGMPAEFGDEADLYRWEEYGEGEGDFEYYDWTRIDDQGRFAFDDVLAGCYTIRVYAYHYEYEYTAWLGGGDARPTSCPEGARTVTLEKGGADRTDLEVALRPKWQGTGSVVQENGEPFPNADVTVWVWDEYDEEWYDWDYAETDDDGSFTAFVPRNATITWSAQRDWYSESVFLGGGTQLPAVPTETNSILTTTPVTSLGTLTLGGEPVGPSGGMYGKVMTVDGLAVEDAYVQACETTTWNCYSTSTASNGGYEFNHVPVGNYELTVWPESDELFDGAGTATVTEDEHTEVATIRLGKPTPLPTGTSVNGVTTGVPSVFVGSPIVLKVGGCATMPGTPTYTFTSVATGEQIKSGSMVWDAVAKAFAATVPANSLDPGAARLTTNIPVSCEPDAPTVAFDVYIDPSGVVTDQYGRPIVGAEATLLRSDTETGAYTVVPDGSTIMSPANRANPSFTNGDGYFRWDVKDGWYKVQVKATGCDTFTTDGMQVPPEKIDLLLKMSCTAAAPTATKAPVISRSGNTLSVTQFATWPQPLAKDGLQWLRNGEPIEGATGSSYELKAADKSQTISVEETGRRPAYVQEGGTGATVTFTAVKAVSNGIEVAGDPLVPSTAPSISGTATYGSILTAVPGTWSVPEATFTYQWLRSGTAIAGATGKDYTVTLDDVRAGGVSVRVTASAPGHPDGVATSPVVNVPKLTSVATLALDRSITVKQRDKVKFTVIAGSVKALTGKVATSIDGKPYKTFTLVAGNNGTLTYKLPKLTKGTHKVKAVYKGNDIAAPDATKVYKVVVKKR